MQICAISYQSYQKPQVNFTSNIRFTTFDCFNSTTGELAEVVESTENQILRASRLKTLGIIDCVAGGITDGRQVVMFHFDPQNNYPFYSYKEAEAALLKKMKKLDYSKLQALILGSHVDSKESRTLFANVEKFMRKHNIKYSKFRGQRSDSGASCIAYFGNGKDEWVITSENIPENDLKINRKPTRKTLLKAFQSYYICPEDHLVKT